MKWFFRRNIFSFHKMMVFVLDLKKYEFVPDFGKDNCLTYRVEELDEQLETKIGQAINALEIKPQFTLLECKARLSQGHYFVVVENRSNGEIVGWVWGAINGFYFDDFNCWMKIRAYQAVIYNSYVSPSERGRNLYSRLACYLYSCLFNNGYTMGWGLVHEWNTAAQRADEKAGMRYVGTYRFLKLLFMNFHFPHRYLRGH